jgi:hypothetical protein
MFTCVVSYTCIRTCVCILYVRVLPSLHILAEYLTQVHSHVLEVYTQVFTHRVVQPTVATFASLLDRPSDCNFCQNTGELPFYPRSLGFGVLGFRVLGFLGFRGLNRSMPQQVRGLMNTGWSQYSLQRDCNRSVVMMPRTSCGIKGGARFTNCVMHWAI